jgi:TolB-like protein/Tfp pilus assembly protein PilF
MRVYALTVGKPAQAKPADFAMPPPAPLAPPKKRGLLVPVVACIAVAIVIAAFVAWYFLARPGANIAANAPAHLSIVVLPFANLSNDPKQDYFADGITENLTTDLSRIRNSFVIARNTAFTYKGKNIDAKEIGKELGVRYVLEGSVQRDGNRVRVNAQLIDAESGAHLWADRFEEDLADLFKLQDDVVARLANTLGYELVKAEAEKSAHSTNPDAIDLTMRGQALLQRQPTKDNNNAARAWFDQALKIDPKNADALAGDANTYLVEYALGWTNSETDYDAKVLGQADRAIALTPDNTQAYYVKSRYLFLSHRPNEARDSADAGLAINQNFAPFYSARDGAEISVGRFEQAKADVLQAMRLSPRDPEIGYWHMQLGAAELGLQHFDVDIEEQRKAINAGDRTFIPYVQLAAAYALIGKSDDAKAALTEARRLNPNLTVKWMIAHAPNYPILFEGLRKAGLPEDEAGPTKHLSIVVLPFTNLSGDPKQDYFADGITENLTTDLSRISGSFVIARNTAFTFKGKNVDAKAIGKELGVRYVLEGSVQRDPSRVRVNVQLIDAETGNHLWAERFDKSLANLFDMQDEIVASLASQLGTQLVTIEARRAERAPQPDSMDLYFQGMAWFNKGFTPEYLGQAQRFFERALALDPENLDALVGTAAVDAQMATSFMRDDRATRLATAEAALTKALSLAPDLAAAHFWLGLVEIYSNRATQGIAECERALALDPNLAAAHAYIGIAMYVTGRGEETEAHVLEALRLSPRDNLAFRWMNIAGSVKEGLGADEDAVRWLRRSIEANRNFPLSHFFLAVALAQLGRQDEARAETKAGLELDPSFTVRRFRRGASSDNPIYLAQHEHLVQGMRKAGVPGG